MPITQTRRSKTKPDNFIAEDLQEEDHEEKRIGKNIMIIIMTYIPSHKRAGAVHDGNFLTVDYFPVTIFLERTPIDPWIRAFKTHF